MKVLVTGATGFIGFQVVKNLVAHGHEAVVISRDSDRARSRFARLLMEKGSSLLHFYGWNSLSGPPPAVALDAPTVLLDDGVDDLGRLGRVRGTGGVGDDAAGAHEIECADQELTLEASQRGHVAGELAPAGFRPAA